MTGLCVVLIAAGFGAPMDLEALCGAETARVEGLFRGAGSGRSGACRGARCRRGEGVAGGRARRCWRITARNTMRRCLRLPVKLRRKHVADAVLEDRFTFYTFEDRVSAHGGMGGLDWTHTGPSDDREWAWALNRHYHLAVLLRAYLATGDAKYAGTMSAHLCDWALHSPYPGTRRQLAAVAAGSRRRCA